MQQSQIDLFEAGGEKIRRAVQGLSREDVLRRLAPGKWSIQELVIHLADMDAIAIDRMKRILTEENPMLLNADEDAYLANLHPHEQSLDDAVTLLEVGRRQFARVLRKLPAEAFDRSGTHNLAGKLTLGDLVTKYTLHLEHHLKFLVGKRAAMHKPTW